MKKGLDMQIALDRSVLNGVILAVERTTYVGDREVALETRLACDLGLGGFGRLKLAIYLEEIFDLEFLDEALERFVTVADVVKHISGRYFRDAAPLWLTAVAQAGFLGSAHG